METLYFHNGKCHRRNGLVRKIREIQLHDFQKKNDRNYLIEGPIVAEKKERKT